MYLPPTKTAIHIKGGGGWGREEFQLQICLKVRNIQMIQVAMTLSDPCGDVIDYGAIISIYIGDLVASQHNI